MPIERVHSVVFVSRLLFDHRLARRFAIVQSRVETVVEGNRQIGGCKALPDVTALRLKPANSKKTA